MSIAGGLQKHDNMQYIFQGLKVIGYRLQLLLIMFLGIYSVYVMLWNHPWTTVSASVGVIIETQQPSGTVSGPLASRKLSTEGTR